MERKEETMKKMILPAGLVVLAASLIGAGCGSAPGPSPNRATDTPTPQPINTNTFTPTATSTKTSTPAVTATPTVTSTATSGIDWETAQVYHSTGNPGFAYVYLAVNGQAVTTAGVTLSGTFSGSPLAMPSDGNSYPISGKNYALYQAFGVSYQPGQTYTLTTVTTAGTASASVTAPGNIAFAALDSHGAVTQVAWGTSGSYNAVYVQENSPTSQQTFSTSVSGSPVTLPGTASPDGSGSIYTVTVQVERDLYTVTGADFSSSFQVYENTTKAVTWN